MFKIFTFATIEIYDSKNNLIKVPKYFEKFSFNNDDQSSLLRYSILNIAPSKSYTLKILFNENFNDSFFSIRRQIPLVLLEAPTSPSSQAFYIKRDSRHTQVLLADEELNNLLKRLEDEQNRARSFTSILGGVTTLFGMVNPVILGVMSKYF